MLKMLPKNIPSDGWRYESTSWHDPLCYGYENLVQYDNLDLHKILEQFHGFQMHHSCIVMK